MVMAVLPTIAPPIAFVKHAAIMPRRYPNRTGIRGTSIIAVVPQPTPAGGVPIPVNPYIVRAWGPGPHAQNSWRGRCSNLNPNGKISSEERSCGQ